MKKRLVAFLLVLIMVLGMLPVSAMAAGSVVTARGSAENPIRIYENSGNQAETSNGSVQVPVGETVTDSGVLTFSTYSAIEGVQVSKDGVYCAVTSSNENVVKATGSWSGGVLTINFLGVGNGTAKITVDYTCTCSKNAVANGLLIYNVTVGDGGSTDPSGKPNAPTASDIGAFPDAGKAVLLHCVDAGARGHDATASSLNKVQNGYSVGEVVENPGTYYNVDGGKITKEQFPWMCVVTVHAAPFIELYNSNFSERYGVHKLAGTSNATATLHWFWHNTYGWQYLENPPIQFNITRDTSEKTYTLNYYKNTTDTVTNMPEPNPQTEKSNTGMVTFTVSSAIPAREGYNFLGWNGKPDATEPTVMPGNTITTPRETTNLYAVWESKTPPPEIPGDQKPNIEEANAKIRVQCIEYPSKHNPYKQNYRILPGSYEDLGWDQTEYGYIYSIRLNRAKYIAQFDQEIGRPHTDTEPNEETRINWRWENGAWHLIDGPDGVTADIKVKCAETPVKPDKPTALDGGFAIVCKNNKATHPYKADYIATPSQYTISDVQKDEQGYYVTATVTVAPNLVAYNKATRVEHRLVDEQDATLTITFRYDTEATVDGNRKWKQQGDLPVVEVICKPKAPTADELKKLEMAVQVKCVVDASQQHTAAYGLLGECDVDYFVFEPRQEGDDWLCDISYYPERYVAEFNTTFQNLKHVQNDEKIVPVTLIWAGGSWQIKTQGRVLVTEVYTVTFDSYGGTPVPPAQEVEYGLTATKPADPTLKGYTFAFWYLGEDEQNATAYDFDTPVTENITLTAKWNINKYTVTFNSYGGTPVPPVQEVEYGLTATKPADPTLKGYTFAFWYLGEDEQNATAYDFDTPVTENITLTAKWHVTPHNIYAFARLNSAFAPLTSVEFGEFVKLNDATLTRLGLGSYNANNYISIGTFSFNKLPLMGDDFMSYYGDEEFDAVVAELADNIVLETGVSKKVAEKIAWTYLFKADNSDYMTEAGYPTDDENGYQLSGNLNLATVMFKANGENVTGMPTVNYTYDDIFEIHDFYFAGDTFTLPADPTREGYSFEGWSVKVIPDENDADHLDADGADDAADETLLKAGDTYTITAGGVIFTAQWKLNTYIIASDLRINGDTANLADGKTYAWTHRYGGNYGETIDYQPMFDALKARALAVDAANEPYDAEIKLCFPGNKNKLFNETILTYGQEGGGWNPGVKNTAYIWGYATTSYEVIFNSDGGSAVDTQIVKYGEKAVKPEDPTMKGYNFLGWFDKDGNPFDFDTEITHKTELKAQWEKKDYIIASDLRVNGGEAVKDEGKTYAWTHRYGGKYEETIDYQPMFDALKARALEADKDNEPNPTKVDVELRFPGSSNLFNETILTYGQDGANWQAANNTAYIWGYAWTYYDVTFVTPEGATTVDAQLIKNGDCAAKPADPTKEGWKFLGWYADAAFKTEFNFDAPITKKTSVYAKFELTSTPIGDIYVRYDVLHIKQLPDGTYDLANAEVEHLRALKDTTVTAVIKDYRATHHVNVNRTLSKLTGTAIQPYMGVDGKPVYTILSVYYDLDFHTLTFDTMGGSKIAPETVRHGLTVAKPKDPVNGGYIFDGWYTDKTFRHRYDFSTPLTEDITIYAKWFLIVLPGVTVKKNTPKLNTADHFAYVQGYPDGTVKPAGNITRAETAAILFRLMDDASRKTYYSTKSGFRDVASGSWYNTYVATLNNAGVITDSSNGYFRPNEAITRAELAAMLAKFSETTGAANYFNDVSAKYWAANAIAICAKLGWITGYPDGTFRPDKNVTRAELMAMINRATGRAPKSADAFLPGMKTWIDNTSDKWYYLDVQEATNSHSYTVKGSETWTALTSDPNWSLYE